MPRRAPHTARDVEDRPRGAPHAPPQAPLLLCSLLRLPCTAMREFLPVSDSPWGPSGGPTPVPRVALRSHPAVHRV